jgi:hypothetical protein
MVALQTAQNAVKMYNIFRVLQNSTTAIVSAFLNFRFIMSVVVSAKVIRFLVWSTT